MEDDSADFVAAGKIHGRNGAYALAVENYVFGADAVARPTKRKDQALIRNRRICACGKVRESRTEYRLHRFEMF